MAWATDWDAVIERNGGALRRIIAMLVAMAGGLLTSPFEGGGRAAGAGGGDDGGDLPPPPDASRRPPPSKGEVTRFTLSRYRRNAILRLLRPAEAAMRRLVVVAARGIVVTLPPLRPRLTRAEIVAKYAPRFLPGTKLADRKHWHALKAAELRALAKRMAAADRRRQKLAEARRDGTWQPTCYLPLIDPLADPAKRRIRHVSRGSVPRIWFPGTPKPAPVPPPPLPEDRLDATRIGLRLRALTRVLNDLPGHARRLARWRARRDRLAAAIKEGRTPPRPDRSNPMKPGGPPGLSLRDSRKPSHEVHHVLKNLQHFAREALAKPDTS